VAPPTLNVRFSPQVRYALILVMPSSVLGANPPSLYLLGPLESPPR